MLTPRQLADMRADANDLQKNPASTTDQLVLARHIQYLLDEVERLSQTDKDRWEVDQFRRMKDAELAKLDKWELAPDDQSNRQG